jgi:hypothetical protein
MKTTGLGILLALVSVGHSLRAESVDLSEPNDSRVKSVRSRVKVTGQLLTAAGAGKTIPLQLSADAQYRFLERRLEGAGRDAEAFRSARLYRFAANDAEVTPLDAPSGSPPKKTSMRLPETRHLIIAHGQREGPLLYSPTATLTYDQVELLRTPGDSLSLLGLLPREPVKAGESWPVETWAVQMLTGVEAMTKGDILCQLKGATAEAATVTFSGSAEGATLGAVTKVDVTGELIFDRKANLIHQARVQQSEKRAVGAVAPGMELTAIVELERSLADEVNETRLLSDTAVANLPVEPSAEMKLLRFESWGLRFYHDRHWHQFHQTSDVAVLRLMEQGSLIAQVNVAPIPSVAAGSHTSEEQFQADIRRNLGSRLKAITKAETLPPRNPADRRFLHRVTVEGAADGLPMTWVYYLCAAPTGQQWSLVFAVETKNLEKFGARDTQIVRLLEFLPARPASN